MIFQMAIDLDIEGKDAQAIIDLDTGLIGFTEKNGETNIEYNYLNCPNNFRIALFDALSGIAAEKQSINYEICRKAKAAELLQNLWKNNNAQKS